MPIRDIGAFESIQVRAKAARLVLRETSGHEFEGSDEELIDRANQGIHASPALSRSATASSL